MKVASILTLAAVAIASVHATGPTGSTCEYGTPAPTPEVTTTAPPTPEPTTTAPPTPDPTTPEPTTTAPPTPDPTTPEPTTPEPTTPEPTTTAPPPAPVDCKLYTKETDPGQYGECKDDGTNKWYKSKVLGIQIPAENGGSDCVSETDPARTVTEPCPAENCKPLSPEADQGEYSACALVNGKYVKSKVLGVLEEAKFGGTCDPKDRMFTQECEAIDCVPLKPEEDKGAFGECKDDGTGKWFKSKILGIKTPASNGGLDCEPDDKRVYSEPCEAVDCVAVDEKDDTGAFGECEKDATTGIYYKYKVLAVKDEAINGGKCDPKDRTVKEECAAVKCVPYTEEEDKGDFGECKDDGTNKWYKTKVLGIKTPAQYGGAECESDDKRTVTAFCDPVPCKAIPVGEDKGEYGDCEAGADGKYVKSKVLGIAEEAKYGGTCDPKDRTVYSPCAGVDCVLYSAEEDPGQFGECKEIDNTGKFQKSKVLGIKIPAKYGGLCAPEKDRTVYEDCPAVNCKPVDAKDDTGAFGECKKDDVTGKYSKSKVLAVKDEAVYGGTCDEKDRIYSEPCEAIDCVAYTKETDPGQFGECKDDGTNKWFKSKILGIKTPAQYGGAECESDDKRTVTELCDPVNCKAVDEKDDTGAFGECEKDESTGIYYKYKVLAVKDEAVNGGTCDPKDRTVKEECAAVKCVPYTEEEDKGDFGECKDDGTNKWYKTKVLGIKTPAQYGGAECESDDKRTVTAFCDPVPCKAIPVGEDKGEYGDCEAGADGKYVKSKVLGIAEEAKYGGTCDPKDRTVYSPCAGVDCVLYSAEEDPGQFGECKEIDNTGKFQKSKVLGIKIPAKYGGLCAPEKDRTVYEDCPAVNCKPVDAKDDTGPFSDCADDGTGKYFKHKVLAVKDEALYGGTCDPQDRIYSEPCEAIDCVAYTKETDPGQFGECKDDGTNKWYKSKVLGIKTPAQYGGAECESEEKRTVSELCEPVNCVPVAEGDDTGAYGECKLDSVLLKYYQYKVLAVKTPAKNGGTCLDKDRTVSKLCPAVPCVIYPANEDPGQFGACVKEGNLYYKSKVLGVKTPPLYGGSCPSETDPSRKYKEQCLPVDCVVTDPATLSWGVCTRATDNKYYRYKVRTIISQPLYGGKACPTTAELTLKELCPQDAYCVPPEPFYAQCVTELGQCGDKVLDKVYNGFELALVKGLQLFECCDRCTDTAGCVAFSFTPNANAANNECSLKWNTDKTSRVTGAISSAPKTKKTSKCSFADNKYNAFPVTNLKEISTNSLVECCDACVNLKNCDTFNLNNGKCELKAYSSVDFLVSSTGWRAGWIN